MNRKPTVIKTRFAPSPTGMLHVGGARTALFNYIFAKKYKGNFVLRVEDTDLKRSLDLYAQKQYEDLCWLGLTPDESPFSSNDLLILNKYKQSERADLYKKNLDFLLKEKKAYFCFCNDEDLKNEKKKYLLLKNRKNYKYSRKCYYLKENQISKELENKTPFSIRFFVDNNKNYEFDDGVRGLIKFSGKDIEDFVIFRKNGIPLLNFVVVVDDYEMEITDVIRAEEHLTNTSKQIALYESLKWEKPKFFHISIITNDKKKKISKRDKGSEYFVISKLKDLGYLPQAIINYLFFLGFNPVLNQLSEIISLDYMVDFFDEKRFNSRPAVFSIEKLNWFNSQWIKRMKNEDFISFSKNFIFSDLKERKNINEIILLFKNQINCFSELKTLVGNFFLKSDVKIEIDTFTKSLIKNFAEQVFSTDFWEENLIRTKIKNIVLPLEKDQKSKFIKSIRKILTNQEHGPDIYSVIFLLGKDEVEKIIFNFINENVNQCKL